MIIWLGEMIGVLMDDSEGEDGIRLSGEPLLLNGEIGSSCWLSMAAWCRILLIEEMWRVGLGTSQCFSVLDFNIRKENMLEQNAGRI